MFTVFPAHWNLNELDNGYVEKEIMTHDIKFREIKSMFERTINKNDVRKKENVQVLRITEIRNKYLYEKYNR